jgi:Phosphorylase superfamily
VIGLDDITVIAATVIEARAIRKACPSVRVLETGVALANLDAARLGDVVISCGLAGGLSRELRTGTVLVPREVRRPDGERIVCDAQLQSTLAGSARRLGYDVVDGPMITSAAIVRGDERATFARRGYVGADMESGLLTAPRIGVIRVILDTPERELSSAWLDPTKAMMNPKNWPEALWLARTAPHCARVAAQVLAGAVSS